MGKHQLAWDCMGCGHHGNQEETCENCGRERGKAKLYDYLDLEQTTGGHKVPLPDVLDRITTVKRPKPPSPRVSPSRPSARPPTAARPAASAKKSSFGRFLLWLLLAVLFAASGYAIAEPDRVRAWLGL